MLTLRIGPFDYAVDIVEDLKNDDGDGLYGEMVYSTRRIRVMTDQPADQRLATLWHEVLHALLEHAAREVKDAEAVVRVLSHGIAQVLRDNPEIRGGDCGAGDADL